MTLFERLVAMQRTDIPCCVCGGGVHNNPDARRLRLCPGCMCNGLLAACEHCGQNYPEHHAGGRGCARWEHRGEEEGQ